MEMLCAYDTRVPHRLQNFLSHTFDTMLHHIHQGYQHRTVTESGDSIKHTL